MPSLRAFICQVKQMLARDGNFDRLHKGYPKGAWGGVAERDSTCYKRILLAA